MSPVVGRPWFLQYASCHRGDRWGVNLGYIFPACQSLPQVVWTHSPSLRHSEGKNSCTLTGRDPRDRSCVEIERRVGHEPSRSAGAWSARRKLERLLPRRLAGRPKNHSLPWSSRRGFLFPTGKILADFSSDRDCLIVLALSSRGECPTEFEFHRGKLFSRRLHLGAAGANPSA